MMRRALAIDEASFGPNHPKVAIRLNNLAQLLKAMNRLDEAEPLMRRHVLIFGDFGLTTGHQHPHFEAALTNYSILLKAIGRSEAEVERALTSVTAEAQFARLPAVTLPDSQSPICLVIPHVATELKLLPR